jgi:hypothetical protein
MLQVGLRRRLLEPERRRLPKLRPAERCLARMTRAFPGSEDDVRTRAGALGWRLTRYAPNNLILQGREIDATTIELERGAQRAFGWLVASCHDDDSVDRIVRPPPDHLGSSRRIGASKLWISTSDADRAAAELRAIAPHVESDLATCVGHLRSRGWVIAAEDCVDDTWDFAWRIYGTLPSQQLSCRFQVGVNHSPAAVGSAEQEHSASTTTLSTQSANLCATIYSSPLIRPPLDSLVCP